MKTRRYAVLGAGRQGRAAAYDLAKFGNVPIVFIVDKDREAGTRAATELNQLLGESIIRPWTLDATRLENVWNFLATTKINGFVSAMHYGLNVALTKLAIDAGCHMVDLGGNTAVVLEQHKLHRSAASAGLRIIPGCGMAPGLNINLARATVKKIKHPRELVVYAGGIPQKPVLPLGYHFPFAISGLVNECSGYADVIQGGRMAEQRCLVSLENIVIPEIGALEATHTSGGLSTAPWTFNEEYPDLNRFEYKTLRYPGHWAILQDLSARGELESGLEALAKETPPDCEDIGVMSVRCGGFTNEGKLETVILEVIDRYDRETGFTAMQRLTGFHASIMLIAAMETLENVGVRKVESIDPHLVIGEFEKRGVCVRETHAVHG